MPVSPAGRRASPSGVRTCSISWPRPESRLPFPQLRGQSRAVRRSRRIKLFGSPVVAGYSVKRPGGSERDAQIDVEVVLPIEAGGLRLGGLVAPDHPFSSLLLESLQERAAGNVWPVGDGAGGNHGREALAQYVLEQITGSRVVAAMMPHFAET